MPPLDEQRETLLVCNDSIEKPSKTHGDWSVERAKQALVKTFSISSNRSYDDENTSFLSRRSWRSYAQPFLTVLCSFLAGFLLCYVIIQGTSSTHDPTSLQGQSTTTISTEVSVKQEVFTKPEGLKVIGFIFFGRPMFVNVLDCYLRKNLAVNGGYLDEVHFLANTAVSEDLDFLDELVNQVPQYLRVNYSGPWNTLWNYTTNFEPETVFIKIDDDVVYIHDNAIPRIVNNLISHPEAITVSAHVVNNPHTHFMQYHTGAILPYLPDDAPASLPTTWRTSDLPFHPDTHRDHFDWKANQDPSHNMTRWLPLPNTPLNMLKTPAANATWPNPHGGNTYFRYDWGYIDSWASAAQTHYSFLHHLEHAPDVQQVYSLGPNLWDQHYERYSINFLAVRAGDIGNRTLGPTDEIAISMRIGRQDDKRFLVDTQALVSHFEFHPQGKLLQTDLLARYVMYANEMVCEMENQKEYFLSRVHRSAYHEPKKGNGA